MTTYTRPITRMTLGLSAVALAAGLGTGTLGSASTAHAEAPSSSNVECSSPSRVFQLRNGGTEIWYASYTGLESAKPKAYAWVKAGTLPKERPGKAIAAHADGKNSVQLIVTDDDGGMRSFSFGKERRTINSGTTLATGSASKPGKYNFDHLASDGNKLYGVNGKALYVMTSVSTTKAPEGFARVEGFNNRPVAMFGNSGPGSFKLAWTDGGGDLHYSSVRNTGTGWKEQSRTAVKDFSTSTSIASPGGNVTLRKSGNTTARTMVDPVDGRGETSTMSKSSAPASGGMSAVPTTCTVELPATKPNTTNEGRAFDYFVAKGYSKVQSAGIVGNLMQESGVDPTRSQEPTGPGRGIAQWSVGDRWDALKTYASSKGKSATSLELQLDFIVHELNTYPAFGKSDLKKATTIERATIVFQNKYEICGDCHQVTRVKYAEQAYDKFA